MGWMHEGEDAANYTPEDWNTGLCDVMAAAISRRYGLPMMGAFERLKDGSTGFLAHAFCRLPDGRMIDAAGPAPMITEEECDSGDDPDVVGFAIIDTAEDDPTLVDVRDHDIRECLEQLRPGEWLERNLDPVMEELGIMPLKAVPAPAA